MEKREIKQGGLFLRNYSRPEKKLSDSEPTRIRVLALLKSQGNTTLEKFRTVVEAELGVKVPWGSYAHDFEPFFERVSTKHFLSSVTLILRIVERKNPILNELRRIFEEESLHYKIDDLGGVHYLVDEQFNEAMRTALEALQEDKFGAARHAFETAMNKLAQVNPSGKEVIRDIFETVEAAFLTVVKDPAVDRLNNSNVKKYLVPILNQRYASVEHAAEHVERVTTMISGWVSVAHLFRHGLNGEQPHEAPLDYAILMAPHGAAILRYIIA